MGCQQPPADAEPMVLHVRLCAVEQKMDELPEAVATLTTTAPVDVATLFPENLTDGWCIISGRARANGVETTFISWCAPTRVTITPVASGTDVVPHLFGK